MTYNPTLLSVRHATTTQLILKYPQEFRAILEEQKALGETSYTSKARTIIKNNHLKEWRDIQRVLAEAHGLGTSLSRTLERLEKAKELVKTLEERVAILQETGAAATPNLKLERV